MSHVSAFTFGPSDGTPPPAVPCSCGRMMEWRQVRRSRKGPSAYRAACEECAPEVWGRIEVRSLRVGIAEMAHVYDMVMANKAHLLE